VGYEREGRTEKEKGRPKDVGPPSVNGGYVAQRPFRHKKKPRFLKEEEGGEALRKRDESF